MKRKILAREILILFGSLILIAVVTGIWYLSFYSNNSKQSTQEILEEKTGFREELFYKIKFSPAKDEFATILEVYHKPTFLKKISDTILNRKVYEKGKEFDRYILNEKYFSPVQLEEKYGEKMDEAIDRFGFRKKVLLTDLTYSDYNKKLQDDKISGSILKKDSIDYKEEVISSKNFKSDFKFISIVILSIAFPFRYLINLIKWSWREAKI